MAAETQIWLHTLGVIVAAKYHNPSILNNEFLVRRGIVPESWNVAETLTAKSISVIKYSNGVQWVADQDRLAVTEACDFPFRQNEDSKVHDRAGLYVETLPHTPYSGLSLTYAVSVARENPGRWITQQFLSKSFHDQELVMQPGFTVNAGEATLHLNFRTDSVNRDGEVRDIVMIYCHIHHKGQYDSATLKNKIAGWKNGKAMILSKLDTMLGAR